MAVLETSGNCGVSETRVFRYRLVNLKPVELSINAE